MFELPDADHKCPACSIEGGSIKHQNRAKQWRKTHGGTPTISSVPSYRIQGARYETTVVERTAKQKSSPNLAPRGLVGSAIPRHLLSKVWARFQTCDSVCSAWRDKEKFIFWARTNGYVLGAELVRIDEDKPFHPSNVKWIADRSAPSNSKYRPVDMKKLLNL